MLVGYLRMFLSDSTAKLPEAKVMFAGNKTFYFDVGTNRYGVFLRISELRANYRTAVTIPEHHWARFRDILNEVAAITPDVSNSRSASDDKSGRTASGEANEIMKTNMNGDGGEEVSETGDKNKAASQNSSTTPLPSEPTAIPVA